jgi:hypothetical protein
VPFVEEEEKMQASSLKPGSIYAIKRDGKIVRFEVESVHTVRYRATGSPHDYKSYVSGRVHEPDDNTEISELDPKQILGTFKDVIETKERAEREEAEKNRIRDEERATTDELTRLLYHMTGLPMPNEPKAWHAPFRNSYGRDISINYEGIVALLQALKERVGA